MMVPGGASRSRFNPNTSHKRRESDRLTVYGERTEYCDCNFTIPSGRRSGYGEVQRTFYERGVGRAEQITFATWQKLCPTRESSFFVTSIFRHASEYSLSFVTRRALDPRGPVMLRAWSRVTEYFHGTVIRLSKSFA